MLAYLDDGSLVEVVKLEDTGQVAVFEDASGQKYVQSMQSLNLVPVADEAVQPQDHTPAEGTLSPDERREQSKRLSLEEGARRLEEEQGLGREAPGPINTDLEQREREAAEDGDAGAEAQDAEETVSDEQAAADALEEAQEEEELRAREDAEAAGEPVEPEDNGDDEGDSETVEVAQSDVGSAHEVLGTNEGTEPEAA